MIYTNKLNNILDNNFNKFYQLRIRLKINIINKIIKSSFKQLRRRGISSTLMNHIINSNNKGNLKVNFFLKVKIM